MVIQDRRLKHRGQPPQNYLKLLEDEVQHIGVTFHVWEVKDSNYKSTVLPLWEMTRRGS